MTDVVTRTTRAPEPKQLVAAPPGLVAHDVAPALVMQRGASDVDDLIFVNGINTSRETFLGSLNALAASPRVTLPSVVMVCSGGVIRLY